MSTVTKSRTSAHYSDKRSVVEWLFATTAKSSRHLKVATLVGVIAGLLSAFVKLGWEQVFPPRTPSRVPEPSVLMHKLGIHYQNFTYTWSGVRINWASFIIHFGFSVIVVVFYCVMAEYIPRIKLWQGAAYGLGIWVVFHLIVMPLMGLTPSTFHLPLDENLSEAFGHIVWLWSAEVVRRDLRSRITHGPDAMTVPRVLATP